MDAGEVDAHIDAMLEKAIAVIQRERRYIAISLRKNFEELLMRGYDLRQLTYMVTIAADGQGGTHSFQSLTSATAPIYADHSEGVRH